MKFTVTEATNFLRVFQLPPEFPEGYCFGGGRPVLFMLVDWFNAFSPEDFWEHKQKQFERSDPAYISHVDSLRAFIKEKRYFRENDSFMVLTDYGDVFLVNPDKRANELQRQMDQLNKQYAQHK